MVIGFFGAVACIGGCSALFPSASQQIESPWENYEAVKHAYDKIVPGQTTVDDLEKIGFDPFKTPNVIFLNYLDIMQKFMPNQSIGVKDLDPAIQKCLAVKENCIGYEISPERISNKRYGNLFLDLFNFNRNTKTSGWRFEALLVAIDNLVVYKLSSGQPRVLRDENKRNPLGPLQDIKVNTPGVSLSAP